MLKRGMLCAKQQRRNRLTVAAQPFHWQIQRGAMRLGAQACFRFRHRLQLWDNAVIVVVQPDTQVTLSLRGSSLKRSIRERIGSPA